MKNYYEFTSLVVDLQLIESGIKEAISIRCAQIQDIVRAKNKFHYVMSISRFERMTLGRLVEEFKQFSSDDKLLKRLMDVVPVRNEFMHHLLQKTDVDDLVAKHEVTIRTLRVDLQSLLDREFFCPMDVRS